MRLHLRWRLFESGVDGAKLVAARECERSVLRHELLEPDAVHVGDRNYSGDDGLLETFRPYAMPDDRWLEDLRNGDTFVPEIR